MGGCKGTGHVPGGPLRRWASANDTVLWLLNAARERVSRVLLTPKEGNLRGSKRGSASRVAGQHPALLSALFRSVIPKEAHDDV